MTTYYIKVGGNDGADGLSEATAWETVSHASATIANGDTVIAAAGTYAVPNTVNPPTNSIWYGASLTEPEQTILALSNGVNFTNAGLSFTALTLGSGGMVMASINGADATITSCVIRCWIMGTGANIYFDTSKTTSSGIVYMTMAGGSVIDCDFSASTLNNIFMGDGITIANYCGGTYNTLSGYNATISGFSGGLDIYGSSGNSVDDINVGGATLKVTKDVGGDGVQTMTNVTDVGAITVAAGAQLIMAFGDGAHYQHGMNIYTVVSAAGATSMDVNIVVTDEILTQRPFEMLPDAEMSVILDTWDTTGDCEKEWRVSGAGSRSMDVTMGNMSRRRDYEICADNETGGVVRADPGGEIDFSYAGNFSVKMFTAKRYYRSIRSTRSE